MSKDRWEAFGKGRKPVAEGFTAVALARLRSTALTGGTPAAGTQPLPVVLLMPGWTMPAATLTTLALELASHGYVAIQIDPPVGSEPGDPPDETEAQRLLAISRLAAAREVLGLLDNPDVIAQIGLLDSARVAAVGHSLGGDVAFAMGADPGIAAVIDLDGGFGSPPDQVPATVPVLVIATELTELWTDFHTSQLLRDSTSVVTVGLHGASHCDVSDLPLIVAATGAGTATAPGNPNCYGPLGIDGPIAVATISTRFLDHVFGPVSAAPTSAELIAGVASAYPDPFDMTP
jgi:dienelactone hydrolase